MLIATVFSFNTGSLHRCTELEFLDRNLNSELILLSFSTKLPPMLLGPRMQERPPGRHGSYPCSVHGLKSAYTVNKLTSWQNQVSSYRK